MEYNVMDGWKIKFDKKYDKYFTLTSNEKYVSIISLNQNFGDFSPLIFELTNDKVNIISKPHLVESIIVSLNKEILITFNNFFGFDEQEEDNK